MSLGATVVLARILTPEDFGVVAMVVPLVIVTHGMGNQAFQTTLIQAHDLTQERASAFFWFAMRANLALAMGFTAVSVVLGWFYDDTRVIPLGAAWALLLWLLTATTFQEAMLKRAMRFPVVMGVQLAALAVGIASGIVAAQAGAGYWAFFVQAVVVEIVRSAAVNMLSKWRPSRPAALGDAGVRSMRAFWRSVAGFRAAAWASEQPDRVLVGRLGGAPTLGVYDTARRWSWYAFTEPFLALSDIAVASLSQVRQDPAQYRLYFARQARAILTIGLAVIAFVAAEPSSVVRVFLGSQWDAAVPFVRLLCVAAFVGSLIRLTEWVYFSSGTAGRLLRWSLLAETPVLLAAVLIGARFGTRGVAIGYTAAIVALALPSLAWCVVGTPLSVGTVLRAAARPAIAAFVAALVVFISGPLLPPGTGAARLVASLVLYCGCFVGAWFATPGGPTAARELAAALRELKPRSR